MSTHWRMEKATEPLHRRVYVGVIGIAVFGVGLWSLSDHRQLETTGVIIAGCASVAALALFGERLGLIHLGAPTLREVIIASGHVALNAGHVHQRVPIASVVRIELRTHRHLEPVLVLVTDARSSCPIPLAAWRHLEVRARLATLEGVHWDTLEDGLAMEDARILTVWEGRPGQACAFTDPPPVAS